MSTVNIATFILDDDQDILDLVKETIDEAGISNYQMFSDEEKFIAGLDSEIHICIIDHKLSKLTGLDILKAVKAKNNYSYVIVYTGLKMHDVTVEYLNNGANKFVDKNKDYHLKQLTEFLKEGLLIARERIDFIEWLRLKAER